MKIGFLQPWASCRPGENNGSMGIFTWEIARRLARSDEVIVCSPQSPGVAAFEEIAGVQFFHASVERDARLMELVRRLRPKWSVPYFGSRLYYCLFFLRATRVLREWQCDVIHIVNLAQFAPLVARFNPSATIVLNMHCDWITGFDYSRVTRQLRHVDGILGCADYITNGIRSRFPQFAGKCETLYNGFDGQTFHPRESGRYRDCAETLITVGRVSPEKGLHVLIDAFEKVLRKKRNAKLRIIGPTDWILPAEVMTDLRDSSRVYEMLKNYGQGYLEQLGDRIKGPLQTAISFVGALPPALVAAEMRTAGVLVQPSLYDLCPLPVLEGMASGLPIVASRVGGLPEMVSDGETGILVEPDDPSQLSEALLMLLEDPRKARAMGDASTARARSLFSWEATASRLRSFYEQWNKSGA